MLASTVQFSRYGRYVSGNYRVREVSRRSVPGRSDVFGPDKNRGTEGLFRSLRTQQRAYGYSVRGVEVPADRPLY